MHTNYRSYGAAIKTASLGEIIDCIRSIDGATRQPTAACTTRNTSKIDWFFFSFLFCFPSTPIMLSLQTLRSQNSLRDEATKGLTSPFN